MRRLNWVYTVCQSSSNFYTEQWVVNCTSAGLGGSVGCAVRLETRWSRVQPRRDRQHSSVEIDHEIFSTVILSLP